MLLHFSYNSRIFKLRSIKITKSSKIEITPDKIYIFNLSASASSNFYLNLLPSFKAPINNYDFRMTETCWCGTLRLSHRIWLAIELGDTIRTKRFPTPIISSSKFRLLIIKIHIPNPNNSNSNSNKAKCLLRD